MSVSIGRRALYTVVPVLSLLVIAELLVRASWAPPDRSLDGHGNLMEPHPTRIWSMPVGAHSAHGGSYRITEQGIRQTPLHDARYTILTTGDSSIFGHGLDDPQTLHEQLEVTITRRSVDVDVRTIAIPGYSSEQTKVVLDEVGWSLEPDLLVIGNLWSDNGIRHFSDRVWMESLAHGKPLAQRIRERFTLLDFLTWQVRPPQREFLPIGWVRDPYAEGRRRVSITEYAQNIDGMLVAAAERGVGALLLSPCNEVLIDPSWDQTTAWDPYFDTMVRIARYRDVPFVSACAALQAEGLTKEVAFLDKMHPTTRGNRLYAAAIAEALADRSWPYQKILADLDKPPFDDPALENWDVERDWFVGEERPVDADDIITGARQAKVEIGEKGTAETATGAQTEP